MGTRERRSPSKVAHTVLYRPSLHMGSGVTCFDQLFMTSKPNFWRDKGPDLFRISFLGRLSYQKQLFKWNCDRDKPKNLFTLMASVTRDRRLGR